MILYVLLSIICMIFGIAIIVLCSGPISYILASLFVIAYAVCAILASRENDILERRLKIAEEKIKAMEEYLFYE